MNPLEMTKFTDRDLIASIVRNFYIVDYGVIHKVNADNTVDVIHAKKQKLQDGKELPQSITKSVQVLTISCPEFSVDVKRNTGDQVLLLGLKDYIKDCGKVDGATSQEAFIHYDRNTLKALPLSVFNEDAKLTVKIEGGNLEMTGKDYDIEGEKITFKCTGFKVTDSSGTAALEVTP